MTSNVILTGFLSKVKVKPWIQSQLYMISIIHRHEWLNTHRFVPRESCCCCDHGRLCYSPATRDGVGHVWDDHLLGRSSHRLGQPTQPAGQPT